MPSDQSKHQLQRYASYASLTVALILVAAKVWAWQQTGSVSILSSLVDSLLDVLASGITVAGVAIALRPADSEHRFGHGKAEGLAALAQSVIITLSAIFVLFEAVGRLFNPQDISNPESGISVMLLSIALTIALVAFQRYVIRRTGSLAISADAMHYRADLAVNLGVLLAIPLTTMSGNNLIDPIVGILIAGYILWSTYDIGSQAMDVLLDRELSDEAREQIEAAARSVTQVKGFHDLRTRFGGNQHFIQFHLELEPHTTLLDAHHIMDDVEDKIRALFPGCEIIVHADPLGLEEERDPFD